MMPNKSYLKWIVGGGVIAGLAVAGAAVFVVISRQPDAIDSPCGPLTPVRLATSEKAIQLAIPQDRTDATMASLPGGFKSGWLFRLNFPDALSSPSDNASDERQVILAIFTDAIAEEDEHWSYILRFAPGFWSEVPAEEIDAALASAMPGDEVHVSEKFKSASQPWHLGNFYAPCPANAQCPRHPFSLYYLIKPKSEWIIRHILMLAEGTLLSTIQYYDNGAYAGDIYTITKGPFNPTITGNFDKGGIPIYFHAKVGTYNSPPQLSSLSYNHYGNKGVETTEKERRQFLESVNRFFTECVLPYTI